MQDIHSKSVRVILTDKILRKYQEKRDIEIEGVKRMYRNKNECVQEKRERGKSRNNWFRNEQIKYDSVLEVPSTPGGISAKRIKTKLNYENVPIKILIQEEVGSKSNR